MVPLAALRGPRLEETLQEKDVAVLGLGVSGRSAARALVRLGARVFLSDSQPRVPTWKRLPAEFRRWLLSSEKCGAVTGLEFGGHRRAFLGRDLLVVSPGVPLNAAPFRSARARGIPVWNELELGWRLASIPLVAAVTGTNGKTTTVSLLGEMFRQGKRRPFVGGNIGKPLCDLAGRRSPFDSAVLECSSYQLEGIEEFRPQVAAVLNLAEDHLHRHGTLARYAAAKRRIFINQSAGDAAVLNADDPFCRRMARGLRSQVVWFSTKQNLTQGISYDRDSRKIRVREGKKKPAFFFDPPRRLPGLHNVENACAAIACARAAGILPASIQRALDRFPGVEHRMETVRKLRGVTYINDSKGTNVDSTLKALAALPGPLWLILGGEDKGAPYTPLRPWVKDKVKEILLIGEAAPKIARDLKGAAPLRHCGTLFQALNRARRRAQAGDSVLLSPACASFDQFENFEDRGNRFKRWVEAL